MLLIKIIILKKWYAIMMKLVKLCGVMELHFGLQVFTSTRRKYIWIDGKQGTDTFYPNISLSIDSKVRSL